MKLIAAILILITIMVEANQKRPEDMIRVRPGGHGPDYAKEWEAYKEFQSHCRSVDKATFDTYTEAMQREIIADLTVTANQGIPFTPRLAGMAMADKRGAQEQLKKLGFDPNAKVDVPDSAQPHTVMNGEKIVTKVVDEKQQEL